MAGDLADLQIPQIIVMREPVPDRVSQQFLKYFLAAFARGESFYLSVREAREKLQGLEDHFPCASWLPIIFQNLAIMPPTWQGLYGLLNLKDLPEELITIRTNMLKAKSNRELRAVLYQVEEFLERYPKNIEGRLLKDTVLQALQREMSVPCLASRSLPAPPSPRSQPYSRVRSLLLLLTTSGLLYLLYILVRWVLEVVK